MIKLVVDISLSPTWVDFLAKHGWPAVHWSTVGDVRAKDQVVMEWAREHGHVVFTHDLDFGTLLALTRARGPSVIQVRTQDVLPQHLAERGVELADACGDSVAADGPVKLDCCRDGEHPRHAHCSRLWADCTREARHDFWSTCVGGLIV